MGIKNNDIHEIGKYKVRHRSVNINHFAFGGEYHSKRVNEDSTQIAAVTISDK
jgi:hypothetical protein